MRAYSFNRPNTQFLNSLGKEIAKLRKLKRLTIEEFAEACGLHSKYIQTIEKGKRNISISVFLKIAHALKISPPKLLKRILAVE